jgi:glycosyltransferase involved in cell wall biosynthesis
MRSAKDGEVTMRILFLTPRPPWPVRRGDQVRAAGLIAELARRNEVRVLALRPPGFPPCPWPAGVQGQEVALPRWRALLGLVANLRLPLQVALHQDQRFHTAAARIVEDWGPDVAVVQLSRLGGSLAALGSTPVVLDLVDSLHLNLLNRAARQPFAAPVLRWEARRMAGWDRRLIRRVAAATVVSERDRVDLARGDDDLAGRLAVLPCGVAVPAGAAPREQSEEVVLLQGNLGYFPTVDGAIWFAREVWPHVRSLRPQAEWWLAGARPVRALRRLARRDGVRVLADPPDLAAVLARASVAVAPLLSGSGTPNKILEAMAHSLPVVTTPEAAAGLDGRVGGEVAVARTPHEFARAVVELLGDPQRARLQATAGLAYLDRHHTLAGIAAQLEAMIEGVLPARPSRG